MLFTCAFQSPVGPLRLVGDEQGLTRLLFPGEPGPKDASEGASPLFQQAIRELEEYFDRRRKTFTVPLSPEGTPFQQQVWAALQTIGYGQTVSYKTIAEQIGKPAAFRAVGQANGKNPIPILIPCHRVIASDGSLGGYSFGLDVKRKLLELEGALITGI